MMYNRLLNIIIVFSILGITAIAVRDFIFSPALPDTQATTTISPTLLPSIPIPSNSDPLTSCQHLYFPSDPNTKWQYQLTTNINLGEQNKKSVINLESEIIATEEAKIIIESRLNDSKKTIKSELICRKSGIFGFPFPIIPDDLVTSFTENNDLLSSVAGLGIALPKIEIDKSILLVPPDSRLTENATWNSKFEINIDLPISLSALSLNLENKIVSIEQKNLPGCPQCNTAIVEAVGTQKDNNNEKKPLITYQLSEGLGISGLEATIEDEKIGSLSINLKLLKFTPAKTP